MPKRVVVEITNRPLRLGCKVIPFTYENNAGMQTRADGSYVKYLVPMYAVVVQGGAEYMAVRFGLVNHGEKNPSAERQCDAGLTRERSVQPAWIGSYLPHTLDIPGRPGAWELQRHFLIHQGSDGQTFGGAIGCVEICGPGRWDAFLAELEDKAELPCDEIGRQSLLTVHVQAAAAPMARLVAS